MKPTRIFCFILLSCFVPQGLRGQFASAGGFTKRYRTPVITTWSEARIVGTTVPEPFDRNATVETPMLGSFFANPTIMIGGDSPTGGGYSPLGQYGTNNLTIYGPLSAFRLISAPVQFYSRGYDGSVQIVQGRSFSTPNYPTGSSVVYPTPNSNYYRSRRPSSRPEWPSPINWLDQN